MSSPAPSRLGRYELLGHLGSGGMCDVYRARLTGPSGFERLVAVKYLRERYQHDAQMVQMLCEEAVVGATLVHPNVAQVYDFAVDDGLYYLVMEYVDGIDLQAVFEYVRTTGRPISLPCTLTIIAQLLAGLESAHRRRDAESDLRPVIHRDVSPGNVLLRVDGWVKISDFGMARPLDRMRKTDPGIVKGKFSYLTPEQTIDLPVDARSDIFQVGIVLWETLTGKSLFKRENEYETLVAVREAPVPPPSSLASHVPPEVDDVVARALDRDPDERYPDALAFRRALEDVLRGMNFGVEPFRVAQLVSEVKAGQILRSERTNEPGLIPWTTDRPPAYSTAETPGSRGHVLIRSK